MNHCEKLWICLYARFSESYINFIKYYKQEQLILYNLKS